MLVQPVREGNAVKGGLLLRDSKLHGDGEASAGAELMDGSFQPSKLLSVFFAEPDCRLDSLLPAPVEEQSLLRRKAESPFIPHAIFQDTQVLE